MGIMKYAVYIGVILLVALFVEQIVTVIYNITLQGVAGDVQAYIIISVCWMVLYLIGRLFLDKRYNPRISQFLLWGCMAHIGVMLAFYFGATDPLLLLVFPCLFVLYVVWKWRGWNPAQFQFRVVHPEFIDDRGGICVLRSGIEGFTLMKFFTLKPPLPLLEILLFLRKERTEFTFEIQHSNGQVQYHLGLIARGKDYDYLHRLCMTQANDLRQHLKRQRVEFAEIIDYLNAQLCFYAPYFCKTPVPLDPSGTPARFPQMYCEEGDVIIQEEEAERVFTLHLLYPHFEKHKLYDFLETLNEEYYLQFHLRPLGHFELEDYEEKICELYRDSVNKLSAGVETDNAVRTAYFLQGGMEDPSRTTIEPLLDQKEIRRLSKIKEELHKFEVGRQIGLWEVEIFLLGNAVLAKTLAIKVGGKCSPLPGSRMTPLVERNYVRFDQKPQILDSKFLHSLLPQSRPIQIGFAAQQDRRY